MKKYAIILEHDEALARKVQDFLFKYGYAWNGSTKYAYLNSFYYAIRSKNITQLNRGPVYEPEELDRIFQKFEVKEFFKAVKATNKPIKVPKWKNAWKGAID